MKGFPEASIQRVSVYQKTRSKNDRPRSVGNLDNGPGETTGDSVELGECYIWKPDSAS